MTISKFPPENPAVVMSDTQPSTKVDGTIWVDTDSDVDVVNPSSFIASSLISNKGSLAAGNGSTAVALSVGTNNQGLVADSAQTLGLKWADIVLGNGITEAVALTQAQYDALTPSATTLYIITD